MPMHPAALSAAAAPPVAPAETKLEAEAKQRLLRETLRAATPRTRATLSADEKLGTWAKAAPAEDSFFSRATRLTACLGTPREAASASAASATTGVFEISAAVAATPDPRDPSAAAEVERIDAAAAAEAAAAGAPAAAAPVDGAASAAAEVAAAAAAGGSALEAVRARIAERYGISTEEYDERKDIPLSERTILSSGEFVGLQQTLKARLRTALHAQEEARLPSYRLKAKVAQHLDTSAAENWGPACALALVDVESYRLQLAFEEAVRSKQAELHAAAQEQRATQQRLASRNRLRVAFQGSRAIGMMRMASGAASSKGGGGGRRKSMAPGGRGGRRKSMALSAASCRALPPDLLASSDGTQCVVVDARRPCSRSARGAA